MAGGFKNKDKIKCLLWSDRHCCLCGKSCGADIEIAHISPCTGKGANNIDNAIPVCYDCHAKIGHYNRLHPRGNKYKEQELKIRRNQIYERHTANLVPPIHYVISQQNNPYNPRGGLRVWPDVTLNIENRSDYLPVKLRIMIKGLLNGQPVNLDLTDSLYSGGKTWNLNPRIQINGHFEIHNDRIKNLSQGQRFEIRVNITAIDVYEREHQRLEDGYVYVPEGGYWYFEP